MLIEDYCLARSDRAVPRLLRSDWGYYMRVRANRVSIKRITPRLPLRKLAKGGQSIRL
jgi:hypothetical protein